MSDKLDIRDVWSRFKDFQHVCLATVEGNRPRVRPVTLVYFDKRLWITTDTWSEKVKQIQENPAVEFCLLFKNGDGNCCIRVVGKAEIIKDRETKVKIAEHCDFFSRHWESVDDPNYTLLEIEPTEIGYVTPEKTTHIKL